MVSQSLTLQASFADLVFLRELTRSTVNKKNRCAWLKSRSDQNISTLKCADAGSSGLACFRSFVSCVSCVMSFVIFVLRSCTVLHHTPGNMTYWAASSAVAPVVRRHLALLDLLVPRECPGQSDRSSDLGLHPISFSLPLPDLGFKMFQELKQWKASRPLATIQHKTDWTCWIHASIASFGFNLTPAALITQNETGSDVSVFWKYFACKKQHDWSYEIVSNKESKDNQ